MVGTRDREAVLNAVWHTPLLAYGTVPWYDFLGIFALGIIFTWLYNSAGASVLIAMIAHLFSNVIAVTMRPLFSPCRPGSYWLIMVVVECLTALAVLIATRGRLGLKPATNVP
jgi:membrane protease YdiL (CAAX protease family)